MCNLPALANVLQGSFKAAANRANDHSRAIKRVRKFTPITLAQTFVIALMSKPNAGPGHIADTAAILGVNVSTQAVVQRGGPELKSFFRALFSEMIKLVVQSETPMATILSRFTEVRLMDSSVISLPKSQAEEFLGGGVKNGHVISSLKLQTELDLKTGQLCGIQIEPGRQTDQGTDRQHMTPKKGSLRITDLGYFNLKVFAMIHAASAFFLSRTQHTVSVMVDDQCLNLIQFLRSNACGRIDQQVVLGTQNKLACRLIAWRVPEAIENKRRRKLRETMADKGRNVTKAAMESCAWEYLITNLSEDQLSFEEAIILYRSRWQIELLFKRWKSYCQIDLLDGPDDEMTMTRMWIRLCGAVLQHWISTQIGWPVAMRISLAKLASLIQKMAWDFASHLHGSATDLIAFLSRFESLAHRRCQRTKRKKNPGTAELLNNASLLEYVLS